MVTHGKQVEAIFEQGINSASIAEQARSLQAVADAKGGRCRGSHLSLALLGDPGSPVEPSGLLPPRAVFRYLRKRSVRLRVAPTVALMVP